MNDLEPMRLGLIYFKSSGVDQNGIYKNSLFLTNAKNEKISNEFSIEAYAINFGKITFWPTIDKVMKYFNL